MEVGPRDGLQNEAVVLSTEKKLELIRRLAECGLRRIEATAFVSPRRVPQLADHREVAAGLPSLAGVCFSALVPNLRGLDAALAAGTLGELAFFTAASDDFARRNIGRTTAESLADFRPLIARTKAAGLRARGYVSTAVDCPFAGAVAPAAVARVAAALLELGCDEVSLGDTTGTGTPQRVGAMLREVLRAVPAEKLAGHFHDTAGAALANIACGLELGVRVFDCSVGGLGGCPFAPGAAGNAATEAAARFLAERGMTTGVDLQRLTATGKWVRRAVNRGSRADGTGVELPGGAPRAGV